jgi:hypothetical protein
MLWSCCNAVLELQQRRSTLRSCCNVVAPLHATELLQRGSTLRSSMLAVELLQRCSAAPWRSSFLLWSCAVAHLHKEGDGSCRRLLLPALEWH